MNRFVATTVTAVLLFTGAQSQTIRYHDSARITQYADSMAFDKLIKAKYGLWFQQPGYTGVLVADTAGGQLNITGGLQTVGNVIPRATGLYDLGSSTRKWDTLYANVVNASGVIGGGETNTASNMAGAGVGVWKDKSTFDLRFKRLKSLGGNLTISDATDSVTFTPSLNPTFDSLDLTSSAAGGALRMQNMGDAELRINGNFVPSTTNALDIGSSSLKWRDSYGRKAFLDTIASNTTSKPLVTKGGVGTRGAQENALEVRSSGGRFIWGVMADSNRWGSQIGDTTDIDPTVRVGDQFRTEMSAWVDEGLMLSRAGSRTVTVLTANSAVGDKFLKVGSITGATLDHTVGIGSDDSVDIKEISRSSNDTIYLRRPLRLPHLSGDSVYIDKWRGSIFPVSANNLPSGTMYLGAEQTAAESTLAPVNVQIANRTIFTSILGNTILSGLTAGSIPFGGTNGVLRQNNSGLFWDSTNARLGIGTEMPQSSVSLFVPTNPSVASFQIAASDVNLDRSTYAQSTDTAALWFSFTGTGKPQFQMQGIAGSATAKIDSNGVGTFGAGAAIIGFANTADLRLNGADGTQTVGNNDIFENGGDMYYSGRGSQIFALDNDANATANFTIKANGTGGSTIFNLDETGAVTMNSVTRGSDSFTTTATTDTVTISGASINDFYFVQTTGSAAPSANDVLNVQKTATGFVVWRAASGTSGLTYDWFRIK